MILYSNNINKQRTVGEEMIDENIRKKLNERVMVTEKYVGCDYKVGVRGMYDKLLPVIILKDIALDGVVLRKELRLNYAQCFIKLGMLKKGDEIQFSTRFNQSLTEDNQYDFTYPSKASFVNDITKRQKLPEGVSLRHEMMGYVMMINKEKILSQGRNYEEWYVERYYEWLAK